MIKNILSLTLKSAIILELSYQVSHATEVQGTNKNHPPLLTFVGKTETRDTFRYILSFMDLKSQCRLFQVSHALKESVKFQLKKSSDHFYRDSHNFTKENACNYIHFNFPDCNGKAIVDLFSNFLGEDDEQLPLKNRTYLVCLEFKNRLN